MTVSVTLAETIPPLNPQRLGVWAIEESVDDVTRVVVRGVIPGTAAEGTLQADDVISKVDQTDVSDLETLRRLLVSAVPKEEITLAVDREGQSTKVKLTPTSIAGPLLKNTIDEWSDDAPDNKWDVQRLRLPDVPNLAAYFAPAANDFDEDSGLAMLMLLLSPDQRDPEEALQSWRDVAGRYGVVVCAVCSEDEKRWQQKEIDVVFQNGDLDGPTGSAASDRRCRQRRARRRGGFRSRLHGGRDRPVRPQEFRRRRDFRGHETASRSASRKRTRSGTRLAAADRIARRRAHLAGTADLRRLSDYTWRKTGVFRSASLDSLAPDDLTPSPSYSPFPS